MKSEAEIVAETYKLEDEQIRLSGDERQQLAFLIESWGNTPPELRRAALAVIGCENLAPQGEGR